MNTRLIGRSASLKCWTLRGAGLGTFFVSSERSGKKAEVSFVPWLGWSPLTLSTIWLLGVWCRISPSPFELWFLLFPGKNILFSQVDIACSRKVYIHLREGLLNLMLWKDSKSRFGEAPSSHSSREHHVAPQWAGVQWAQRHSPFLLKQHTHCRESAPGHTSFSTVLWCILSPHLWKCWSLNGVRFFMTPWTVVHQAPHPWAFHGKDTGVGCHFLLQGIFPTQGSNLGLTHCRQTLPSEPPGKFWPLTCGKEDKFASAPSFIKSHSLLRTCLKCSP